MTREVIGLDALAQTQAMLLRELPARLTANHRAFLLSLVAGDVQWDMLPFAHLRDLPALKWKLLNLAKLKKSNPRRFQFQHDELAARFSTIA
jgi:hypothetical protein